MELESVAVGNGWRFRRETFKDLCKTSRSQFVVSAVLVLCKTALCGPSLASKMQVSMYITEPCSIVQPKHSTIPL